MSEDETLRGPVEDAEGAAEQNDAPLDQTGVDAVRDPAGDSGRPQESAVGARPPEAGLQALPDDHPEAERGADEREASDDGDEI